MDDARKRYRRHQNERRRSPCPYTRLAQRASDLDQLASFQERRGRPDDARRSRQHSDWLDVIATVTIPETRNAACEMVLRGTFLLWDDEGTYGPRTTALGEEFYQAYRAVRDGWPDAKHRLLDVYEQLEARGGPEKAQTLLWTVFQALHHWNRSGGPLDDTPAA
jgi:hypothetical protein